MECQVCPDDNDELKEWAKRLEERLSGKNADKEKVVTVTILNKTGMKELEETGLCLGDSDILPAIEVSVKEEFACYGYGMCGPGGKFGCRGSRDAAEHILVPRTSEESSYLFCFTQPIKTTESWWYCIESEVSKVHGLSLSYNEFWKRF